jgi:hypothetical protein
MSPHPPHLGIYLSTIPKTTDLWAVREKISVLWRLLLSEDKFMQWSSCSKSSVQTNYFWDFTDVEVLQKKYLYYGRVVGSFWTEFYDLSTEIYMLKWKHFYLLGIFCCNKYLASSVSFKELEGMDIVTLEGNAVVFFKIFALYSQENSIIFHSGYVVSVDE